MILTKTKTKIGPRDHGRKMSLRAFEFAPVEEGYLYELARGYIVAFEIPVFSHSMQLAVIRSFLAHYDVENPNSIYVALGSLDCKLLILTLESERHPDLAVYLATPKGPKDQTVWRTWVPELVIEV